eukprot:7470-Heterococcus_DN1.PRE.3
MSKAQRDCSHPAFWRLVVLGSTNYSLHTAFCKALTCRVTLCRMHHARTSAHTRTIGSAEAIESNGHAIRVHQMHIL